jgi:NADP-dependent 3-hydroxy acid dehydrogenase YdfG
VAGALEGSVAAVTGASSGIGEASALAFAREGAAVALGARRRERLAELTERIESEGGRALAIETDVTDEAQSRRFVETAHAELGGLSILLNNAGLMLLGPIEGADTSEWRRMVEVNLLGVLWCTHAALPLMREAGGGDIVNVSSVAGRRSDAGAAVYNMTKWGVTGFSEALRQEALHADIRVTCIEPGFVETELQGHNTNPVVKQATERMREQVGEVLKAEDIAELILFAVSRPPRVDINEVLIRPTGQRR